MAPLTCEILWRSIGKVYVLFPNCGNRLETNRAQTVRRSPAALPTSYLSGISESLHPGAKRSTAGSRQTLRPHKKTKQKKKPFDRSNLFSPERSVRSTIAFLGGHRPRSYFSEAHFCVCMRATHNKPLVGKDVDP